MNFHDEEPPGGIGASAGPGSSPRIGPSAGPTAQTGIDVREPAHIATAGQGYDRLAVAVARMTDELSSFPGDPVSIAREAQAIEGLGRAVQRAQVIIAGRADAARVHQARAAGSAWALDRSGGRSEFRNTAEYLVALLRISRSEANSRLLTATSVLPSTSLVGGPIPPRRPRMAEVFHTGEASLEGMVSALRPLDAMEPVARQRPGGGREEMDIIEAHLAGKVLNDEPGGVRKDAEKLAQRIDQDGLEPTDDLKRANQGLFFKGRYNGLFKIELHTTAEQYEFLKSAFGPENNPRRHGIRLPSRRPAWAPHGVTGAGPAAAATVLPDNRPAPGDAALPIGGIEGSSGSTPTPAEGGSHSVNQHGEAVGDPTDERTPAQRFLDGLVNAAKIALATNTLPRNGGLAPQVFVTIDYETLRGRLAKFEHHASEAVFAGPITPRSIRKLACNADLIPLVLGDDGEVLDLGRSRRLFTDVQRKALIVRDGGCTFGGCPVPGTWCEAHHVDHWADGGCTDVCKGALVCSYHHHLLHEGNWEMVMHHGRPHWRPPAYVDPTRTLVRNTYFRT